MWTYQNKLFTNDLIGSYYGFVYCITNTLNNRKYIGRKYFYAKKTLPPLKGKKRKRRSLIDSNWKEYWGSSKILMADIELVGKDNFKREIISLHVNKAETNYSELAYQIVNNVLESRDENGNRIYYNGNILSRYYPSKNFADLRLLEHKNRINDIL